MTAIVKKLLAGAIGLVALNGAFAAGPVSIPPSAVQTAPSNTMTNEELEGMLKQMGYEFTVSDSEDKKTRWFHVNVNRRELGGTVVVTVSLSASKKKLWCSIDLVELKPEHRSNSEALEKLLELNAAMGTSHFRLDPKSHLLYLSRVCDVSGMTVAKIRDQIDEQLEACVKTKDSWNIQKWGGQTAKK